MTETILEFLDVRKVYGDIAAIERASFSLAEGEFLTLLGPSGSGKTTTLQLIAGLMDPSEGTILLDGQSLVPLPPYKRNIGVVFQHYALFPHLSVAKNIGFPLEMRQMPKQRITQKVMEVLERVGLPEYAQRYPNQLSGGQQQRVALARALVFEPRLLLMDEPLGALDRKLREQIQLEIVRIHRELKIPVIYVTHDQEEALAMSDRIAIFRNGWIEQIGRPEELYENPCNRFVADFVGQSNLFSGVVTEFVNEYCRIDGDGSPFKVRSNGNLKVGDRAVVVVRPERIELVPASVQVGQDNNVSGVIQDVIYVGGSRKYVVQTPGGKEAIVLQPVSNNGTGLTFGIGDIVWLRWQADAAAALLDDPAY